MQQIPAVTEMDDAAIEKEIDILFEKMKQGLADMKRQREADAAQWERIDDSMARINALQEETRQLMMKFRMSF